jgi:predicted neutral ceramidase superfamily lipid hydrolase
MKKATKFSIKDAEKVYEKINKAVAGLHYQNFSEPKETPSKVMENWVTVGGSSDFDKRLVMVNSWQTGVKY